MKHYSIDYMRILSTVIGSLFIAIATNGLLIPNNLLSGGVSGLAMLLHFIFGFKVSLLIVLINIPIFILALICLSKTYLVYSIFGTLMLSFWLEVTSSFVIPTSDPISIIAIAGLIYGLGSGIIFRANASTGGTDIISKIINRKFGFSMASVTLVLNAIIICLSIYYFDIDIAVVTVCTMYFSSHVVTFVVDGINRKRTLNIVTEAEHYEALAHAILQDINRGVTVIPATGAYTEKPKYILLTTVGVREVAKTKRLILSIDPHAFMTVTETSQVIGNGRGFLHS